MGGGGIGDGRNPVLRGRKSFLGRPHACVAFSLRPSPYVGAYHSGYDRVKLLSIEMSLALVMVSMQQFLCKQSPMLW